MKKKIYIFFVFSSIIFFFYVVKINIINTIENSGWFYIKKVTIDGVQYLSREEIIEKLDIDYTHNIMSIDTKQLKSKLELDSRIKVLSLKVRFPDEIYISLEEREGDYIVYLDNQYYYSIGEGMEVIASGKDILNYDKPILAITTKILEGLELTSKDFYLGHFRGRDDDEKKELSFEDKKNLIENSLFLKTIVDNIGHLKKEDQDFLNVVSVIKFTDNSYVELYLNSPQMKIYMDMLFTENDLRKARYAYIYNHQSLQKAKNVDVRGGLVKYTF